MPFFSIIVPVYNRENFLDRSIGSLINQTFRDIEIICIDDGSTDGSLNKLNSFAEKDNRIKVIHQKNGGVSRARNIGLANATGEYIMFLDSDDEYKLECCEKCFERIQRENPDVVSFEYTKVDDDLLYDVFLKRENFSIIKKNKTYNYSHQRNFGETFYTDGAKFPLKDWPIWNLCIRKSILDKFKIKFIERIKYNEDAFFTFSLFLHQGLKISLIFESLVNYYNNKKGLSKDKIIGSKNEFICLKWLRFYNKKYNINTNIALNAINDIVKKRFFCNSNKYKRNFKNYIINKIKKEKFFDTNYFNSSFCFLGFSKVHDVNYGFEILETSDLSIEKGYNICNSNYVTNMDIYGINPKSAKIKLKIKSDSELFLMATTYDDKYLCYKKIIVNGKNLVKRPFYANDSLHYYFKFKAHDNEIVDIEIQMKKFDLLAYIRMKIRLLYCRFFVS